MKWVRRVVIALVVLFVLAQLYRPPHTNPPVDPAKTLHASATVPPQVEQIFNRSCRDCHTNETTYPWYSNVAPMSWLLADHIKDGRAELNFSEWQTYQPRKKAKKLEEICEQVKEGEMPVSSYTIMHPDARLSDADKQTLCSWAQQLRGELGVPASATRGGEREAGERGERND